MTLVHVDVVVAVIGGLALIGLLAYFMWTVHRIKVILEARGLDSPHVIVSTGEGGVMRGMNLDISGPGYKDEPLLTLNHPCEVTHCRFIHAGGVETVGKMIATEKTDG